LTQQAPARRSFDLFLRYWLPVLVYVAAIITLSAQPRLRPPVEFQNADKLYHVLEYLVLGVLLARAFRATSPADRPVRPVILAVVVGVAFGAFDEYFQSFVPGRISSVRDLIADAVGVTFAQVGYLFAAREPRGERTWG
jgi:VanZ family protein